MEAAIVECATRLFAEKGFHSPTLRDITSQAGVSLPIVYWFFADKRDLYIECCIRTIKGDLDGIYQAVKLLDHPHEVIFAFARENCAHHLAGGSVKLVHRALLDNDEEILERVAEVLFKSAAHRKVTVALKKIFGGGNNAAERMHLLLHSFTAGLVEHSGIWRVHRDHKVKQETPEEIAIQVLQVIAPSIEWAAVGKQLTASGQPQMSKPTSRGKKPREMAQAQ